MKPAIKTVIALAPASTTNGATQTANIDTLGFDHLSLDICGTTADVVSNKYSVCKLSEADTTDATNFSDITKFVAGGTGGFTLASANTSSPYAVKLNLDCTYRKRYIKLTVSPRTTQTLWAHASLQKGEQAPVIAADANVNTLVEG